MYHRLYKKYRFCTTWQLQNFQISLVWWGSGGGGWWWGQGRGYVVTQSCLTHQADTSHCCNRLSQTSLDLQTSIKGHWWMKHRHHDLSIAETLWNIKCEKYGKIEFLTIQLIIWKFNQETSVAIYLKLKGKTIWNNFFLLLWRIIFVM